MSSSEEYLDSLLESILNGGKSNNTAAQQQTDGKDVSEGLPESGESKKSQTGAVKANKAMSTEEIEEMLMSMGTLGGEDRPAVEENQSDNLVLDSHAEEPVSDGVSLDDLSLEEVMPDEMSIDDFSLDDLSLDDMSIEGTDDLSLDGLGTGSDDLLPDGLETEADGLSMESAGPEGSMSDEMSVDDFSLDDLSLDDMSIEGTDDLSLDGLGTGSDDLLPDGLETEADGLSMESAGPEGSMSDEMSVDDFSLDDLSLDDMSIEGTDDLSLDGLGTGSDDLLPDGLETETDGLSMESAGPEGSMSDEMSIDDFSLDDLSLDDISIEGADDLSLGGLGTEADSLSMDSAGPEGSMSDEMSIDDFSLDDLSLDDMSIEGADDLSLDGLGTEIDDLVLEDFGTEEPMAEEFSLDNLSMGEDTQNEETLAADVDDLDSLMADMDGELSLDDLSMNEETMSEEDIDRLLSGENLDDTDSVGLADDLALSDGFALEETGTEEDDLSALLSGMDHDEDLSEINDLLEKSDQGLPADDDMLAMLGDGDNDAFDFFSDDNAAKEAASIREVSPEELEEKDNPKRKKEKRKRKKKEKKPRNKKGAGEEASVESGDADGLASLLENAPEEETEKPKKQGFGAKLAALLFEGDEDEDSGNTEEEDLLGDGFQMGNLTNENRELLQELSDEDKKNSKKKGKKDKKKKKGKKGQTEEAPEEGEEGEETEQKEKKPKKKKKKKKEESEEASSSVPEKKLAKKKVITVFLFCGTIAACIILMTSFLPNYLQKNDARVAYDHGYYGDVYDLLYGKKLNEEDETLFQKSSLILQMDRKITSYENYSKMGKRLEALDALLSGVARYQEMLPKAEQYHVTSEVRERYDQIIERLSADFGVSEADALETVASEDDVTYTQRVQAIIDGIMYGAGEDVPEVKQDVLLEEEEIISRLEGIEEEADLPENEVQQDDFQTEEPLDNVEQADGSDN